MEKEISKRKIYNDFLNIFVNYIDYRPRASLKSKITVFTVKKNIKKSRVLVGIELLEWHIALVIITIDITTKSFIGRR